MKNCEASSDQGDKWKMCLTNMSSKMWALWEENTLGIGGQEGATPFGRGKIVLSPPLIG